MKTCLKCSETKDILEFGKDKRQSNGFWYYCKACEAQRTKDRRIASPEVFRERDKLRRAKNKKKFSEQSKARYAKNPEAKKQSVEKWRKNNLSKAGEIRNRYRLRKINAMPNWLTPIHMAQIQEFYDIALAKTTQTGIIHHVDHIHPLRGNGFNGLHVPWNLQVLTKKENLHKLNNMPPEDAHLIWSK